MIVIKGTDVCMREKKHAVHSHKHLKKAKAYLSGIPTDCSEGYVWLSIREQEGEREGGKPASNYIKDFSHTRMIDD